MRKKKKEESEEDIKYLFPIQNKKTITLANPRISHACKMLKIIGIKPDFIEHIRVSYEGEDPCTVYVKRKNGSRFIPVRKMTLTEFSFFAGYLGFGDIDRFETGIDANSENPVLIDPYFGRVVTLCLDLPSDIVSLVSETNNFQDDFGEWHSAILRNELSIEGSDVKISKEAFIDFLRSLNGMSDFDEDDFD